MLQLIEKGWSDYTFPVSSFYSFQGCLGWVSVRDSLGYLCLGYCSRYSW